MRRCILIAPLLTSALTGQSINLAGQSSAMQGAPANRANDGLRDGFWSHNSVSMTAGLPGSWWQVSFAPYLAHEIPLFARSDYS